MFSSASCSSMVSPGCQISHAYSRIGWTPEMKDATMSFGGTFALLSYFKKKSLVLALFSILLQCCFQFNEVGRPRPSKVNWLTLATSVSSTTISWNSGWTFAKDIRISLVLEAFSLMSFLEDQLAAVFTACCREPFVWWHMVQCCVINILYGLTICFQIIDHHKKT